MLTSYIWFYTKQQRKVVKCTAKIAEINWLRERLFALIAAVLQKKTQSGAGQRNVAKGVLLILAGVAVIVITILWAVAQYNAY